MVSTLVRPESSPSALLAASFGDDGDDDRTVRGAGTVLGVVLGRNPTHGETLWESSASSDSAAVETADALPLLMVERVVAWDFAEKQENEIDKKLINFLTPELMTQINHAT